MGLKGVKATHGFRAGYITQMFEDEIDPDTIRRSAGYSGLPVTTRIFSEPDAQMKKAVKR